MKLRESNDALRADIHRLQGRVTKLARVNRELVAKCRRLERESAKMAAEVLRADITAEAVGEFLSERGSCPACRRVAMEAVA
jgi:glycyl-tRNA synthetase beta subunit